MRKKADSTAAANAENSRQRRGRDIRWERLDNTAHLFPVIAGEQMSSVYRISATLSDEIEPQLLQRALDMVLPLFDGFNLRIRAGVFWHYFEENGRRSPTVTEENSYPCRFIRASTNNAYMFRVTYYGRRINLEVYHVLTDGMGAVCFLRELVYSYLRLKYPKLIGGSDDELNSCTSLNREDSFLRHYRRQCENSYKTKRAYCLKGEKLSPGELGVMHVYLNIPQLKQLCRSYEVSINEFLVAAVSWSIYSEYGGRTVNPAAIRVAVPVNLRPLFNSITTKNFFAVVSSEFLPDREDYSFEQLLEKVRDSLRSQMNRETLEQIFSYNVSRQRKWYLRIAPLFLKSIAIRTVYSKSALANTTTLTNIGSISVSEQYRPYIEQFHAYLSVCKGQPLRCSVCSYGDTLTFSFAYDVKDSSVQRGFCRLLSEHGLKPELETNGVNYG